MDITKKLTNKCSSSQFTERSHFNVYWKMLKDQQGF